METAEAHMPAALANVPRERWPSHIAIIMDGNGRWAQQQGLPRIEGHRRGADSVRRITEESARLGIEELTLYCLSSENWKRPQEEIDFLMHLMERYAIDERSTVVNNNIRARVIGRREGLPEQAVAELEQTIRASAGNSGMWVNLAINYGGRAEILDATKAIATQVAQGKLAPESIDEDTISNHLYTAGSTDPDLLIRTAGEMRISNFLLWQISYAEIWVTGRCWPEFDEGTLHEAIADYAKRNRKFGGLADSAP